MLSNGFRPPENVGVSLETLIHQTEFLALISQVQKNLSSPEFVRAMIADTREILASPFHYVTRPALDSSYSIASQMDEAQAIHADILNERDKAQRAIYEHQLRAVRLEQADQSREFFA